MLSIIKATDPLPVEQIVLCVYAAPGLGKTSLGFTASRPLLLDFDAGAHRASNRKDTVRPASWTDVDRMSASDFAPFDTVVVDTAGRALDMLSLDIISKNPKHGKGSGALSLQGFGELKARFLAWMNLLKSFHKDVVLICHMSEERNGDEVIERIDAQGASRNEIYKSSDAMCRILVKGRDRLLSFDPREGGFGKNPAQFEELLFLPPAKDPTCLLDIIARIKRSINHLAEQAKQTQEVAEDWAMAIREMEDLASVNRMLADVKKAPKTTQAAFDKRAKGLGFTYDKAAGAYVQKAAA